MAAPEPETTPTLAAAPPGWLTRRERQLGVVNLALIADWQRWVHRRVETVAFQDTTAVIRRVSIDFTLPDVPTPIRAGGQPLYLVPLGFLRKRKLTNFSLRDGRNGVLSMLSKPRNGSIAAATLLTLARAGVERSLEPRLRAVVPQEVVDDIWAIANWRAALAQEVWERLGSPRIDTEASRAWRQALVQHDDFMALASDFARNFLVMTPIAGAPGVRRVVKLSYEEQGQIPTPGVLARWRRAAARREDRRQRREQAQIDQVHTASAPGVGQLRVTARLTDRDRVSSAPLAGLRFTVAGDNWRRSFKTRSDGVMVVQLPAGDYTIQEHPPPGYLELSANRQAVSVAVGTDDAQADFLHLQLQGAPSPPRVAGERLTSQSVYVKATRAVGLRHKPIAIATAALGQGRGYHFEFEAPEGLQITCGRLFEHPPYMPAQWSDHYDDDYSVELNTVQRIHLHLAGLPAHTTGLAVVNIRPRSATIVRAALSTAALTTALLAVVAWRWSDLTGITGALATILLIVPGGLGAYVARSREHPFTTELLAGIRLVALSTGFLAFVTAVLLIVTRSWDQTHEGLKVGHPWEGTQITIDILTAASLAIFILLAVALGRIRKPPERKTLADPVKPDAVKPDVYINP